MESNQQILKISNQLFSKLPELLKYFEIDFIEYPNRYAFACPIHGGDNTEGCCVFLDGNSVKGNWNCWTNHCEDDHGRNLFGFVKGVLSNKAGGNTNIYETVKFCMGFLGLSDSELKEIKNVDSNNELKLLEIFNRDPERSTPIADREAITKELQIPAAYYINRGYSEEVLTKFDVGLCSKKNKPMSNRIVVPIYDEGYNYIGCIGRSIYENMKPKWLHSRGFRKSSYLYGLNLSKDKILETRTAFIVEGQGDVWRLHEAGVENSVGIFGSNMSDDQLVLLEKSGALNLVILTDYDEAGHRAAEQIVKKCGRRFNYHRPTISQKDIGDMTIEQINNEVLSELEGILV
jgi:5S rRNA maturation endonuclease (ribonuclease M5)